MWRGTAGGQGPVGSMQEMQYLSSFRLPKDSLGGGPRSQQNPSSKRGFWERVAGRMHGPSMRGGVGVPSTVDARKGCQPEPLGLGRSGPRTHSLPVPCVGHLGAGGGTHSPALPDFYPDPRNTEEPPREDGCWPPGVPWPLTHTVRLGTRPLIPEGWSPPDSFPVLTLAAHR